MCSATKQPSRRTSTSIVELLSSRRMLGDDIVDEDWILEMQGVLSAAITKRIGAVSQVVEGAPALRACAL